MNANTKEGYEHFKLIRESPAYRNFLRIEEMQAEMQPSLAQEKEKESFPPYPPIKKEKKNNEEPWSKNQWDVVNQLRAGFLYLQNNLNIHIDKSSKGKNKYYKYV